MRYFKIEKALVSFIIVILFSSNCSTKHLIYKEGEILSREIIKTWDELQSEIIRLNKKEILLNLKEIECRAIKDSIKMDYIYKYGKKHESGEVRRDYELGIAQLLGGLGILVAGSHFFLQGILDKFNLLKVISGAAIGIAGGIIMHEWSKQFKTEKRTIRPEPEEKIMCEVKDILIDEPVSVSLKDKFEKKYITDSLGNILIDREELTPYISKSDSNVILKIRYKDISTKLFITVNW